jgi:pimeloyl-ACP methyl ester carboxylesterase
LRRQLDPDIMVQRAPTYADQLAREHGSRWRQLARQSGDLVFMLAHEGLTEGMARRAQLPLLVSVGDRDEMVSLAEAARLSRLFPQGQLLVLPGVHHAFSTLSTVPLIPTMKQFHRK